MLDGIVDIAGVHAALKEAMGPELHAQFQETYNESKDRWRQRDPLYRGMVMLVLFELDQEEKERAGATEQPGRTGVQAGPRPEDGSAGRG